MTQEEKQFYSDFIEIVGGLATENQTKIENILYIQ